jgi:hypothetical protein
MNNRKASVTESLCSWKNERNPSTDKLSIEGDIAKKNCFYVVENFKKTSHYAIMSHKC